MMYMIMYNVHDVHCTSCTLYVVMYRTDRQQLYILYRYHTQHVLAIHNSLKYTVQSTLFSIRCMCIVHCVWTRRTVYVVQCILCNAQYTYFSVRRTVYVIYQPAYIILLQCTSISVGHCTSYNIYHTLYVARRIMLFVPCIQYVIYLTCVVESTSQYNITCLYNIRQRQDSPGQLGAIYVKQPPRATSWALEHPSSPIHAVYVVYTCLDA